MPNSTFEITLSALTDEQIKYQKISDTMLWFLRNNEVVHGPFQESVLKDYIFKNAVLMESIEACNAEEKEWKAIFEHPRLGRRIGPVQVPPDGLFILVKGQKAGPYKIEEVQSLIAKNHVYYTDLFSDDSEKTWKRLYDHPQLNRRLGAKSLPQLPEAGIFAKADSAAKDFLNSKRHQNQQDEADAVIGLAFKGSDQNLHEDDGATAQVPPPIDSTLVGPKVGKGPKYTKEELPTLDDLNPSITPPPLPEAMVAEAKLDRKKVIYATSGAIVVLLLILSGGNFKFASPEKTADVMEKTSEVKTVIPLPELRENAVTNPAATRMPANQGTPNPNSDLERQKRLRESFQKASTIQQTHQNYQAREPAEQPGATDDYPFEERIEEAQPEIEQHNEEKLTQQEATEGQELVEEIRKEQNQLDADSPGEEAQEVGDF
ncbi:MAG: hypothetical protein JNM93_09330 [Bacteriovoracaceae bacterium]|nr:hypothetical protein [Bacteriovoracaceae bacterium]